MFKRIGNLIRGFFGLFVSGLEKQNPEALLEVERENLRKQIAQYNQGLAAHAGLCERLITQVKKLEIEERELRAKTTALLRSDNRDAAGQTALRLQTIQRELTEDRTQLEQSETTYRELIRARPEQIVNHFCFRGVCDSAAGFRSLRRRAKSDTPTPQILPDWHARRRIASNKPRRIKPSGRFFPKFSRRLLQQRSLRIIKETGLTAIVAAVRKRAIRRRAEFYDRR